LITTIDHTMEDKLGLPRDLGGGLVLRWGKSEDSEPLATFLGDVFAQDGEPDESVVAEIRDFMRGDHPTVSTEDFLLVTDENADGKIVSTLFLISQIWAYEGVPFGVGQIEAVATDPAYRRRGLIREQMKVIHARSTGRGELMQVIGGVPWYYRQFGYEMGLPMQAVRDLYWDNITKLEKDETEIYRLRCATPDDIEMLKQLYDIHCASSMVTQIRSDREWEYELTATHPLSESHRRFYIIEEIEGSPVGYLELGHYEDVIAVRELAVLPRYPLRMVCEFLTRALKTLSDERAATEERDEPYNRAVFSLGTEHPGYTALGKQLGIQKLPYAWYTRIADLPGFLRHIAPALNKRLQNSVFDGYSGTLRLNFYTSQLTLVIERGELMEVGTYTPNDMEDSDAAFLDLTFLQLLLGYRSLSDLQAANPDCTVKDERSAVLLDVLFPKKSSSVAASG
jgi:N-acetylglutamate synthase-like GNAT family acetyltransferase